jgi:predicted RNA binding protein YcfA (HicA-like mRNA interferase family)
MSHDLKDLIRDAVAAGFQVARTRSNHVKFVAPNGTVIFGPSTPSDHRSLKNVRAKLRRVGLNDRRTEGTAA